MYEDISASLELCSERRGDITEEVYDRFFRACSDALPVMGHSDPYMKGRMLAQVIELLLTDEHDGDGGYLHWEVDNHVHAYNVDVSMYPPFFNALQDTVKDGLGEDWTDEVAAAWASRVDELLNAIYAEASA